jgi:imidazolonepropionase-like amidohydrolase
VAGFDILGGRSKPGTASRRTREILTRHGVPFSIGADSVSAAAHLNWEAGKLMDNGLSLEEALATITINPAASSESKRA